MVHSARSQTYNFKNYNTEQGLPQSQVLSITQDSRGNMWFGTNSGGVGKFDGNKFTTYTDNDGLVNNVVFSVIETQNKQMVFGTNRGISVFNGFYFKNFGEKEGLKNTRVFRLVEANNKIWIGTEQGVYTMQDGRITPFTDDSVLNRSSVFSMFIDSQNRIWFATFQSGAICYNPATDAFLHFSTANGLMENWVFSIGQASNENILVGTRTGLSVIDPKNKVSQGNYIPRQENASFSSILTNAKNEQWFGTYAEGVMKYDNEKVTKYNLKNGLTNNAILCLYTDREKNIWIGTDGSGVYKYSGERFISYTKDNGLPESYINAIAQDRQGNVWIASRGMGVSKLEDGKITNFMFKPNVPNALPDNDVTTMLCSKSGVMWFGTRDGLCYLDNNKFIIVTDNNFRHQYILSLFEDSKNNLWIGTNKGLYRYSNHFITDVKLSDGTAQGELPLILSVAEDRSGHIWVGTENGAVELNGQTPVLHDKKNGFVSKRVLSIVSDFNRNLWLGTEEGIYHYDYSKFTKISQNNGLSSNFINLLIPDQNKNLFVGTNNGLDKLDMNAFYNHHISIKHYVKEDGLVNLECNANACLKDNMGRLWFGTINGVEIYNPKEDFFNAQEPVTHITNVKLFFSTDELSKYVTKTDSLTKLPESLVLPYNKNHITLEYVGV